MNPLRSDSDTCILFVKTFIYFYVDGCLAYMYVSIPWRSEEGAGSPGIVTEDGEPQYGYSEANLGPLKEPVFLSVRLHITPIFSFL